MQKFTETLAAAGAEAQGDPRAGVIVLAVAIRVRRIGVGRRRIVSARRAIAAVIRRRSAVHAARAAMHRFDDANLIERRADSFRAAERARLRAAGERQAERTGCGRRQCQCKLLRGVPP